MYTASLIPIWSSVKSTTRSMAALALIAAMFGAASNVFAQGQYQPLNDNADGRYQIDPDHSQVFFTLGHVGIAPFTGRFNKISGQYTIDSKHPGKNKAEISISVDSIDTNLALRNEHLLSKEFFDAKNYPEITFTSTSFVPNKQGGGNLHGLMSFHGVTRPEVFHVEKVGAGEVAYLPKPWGGYLSGFVATTTIKRSDFGLMAYLPQGLSNDVHITVNIEGIRAKP
ncbi:YceI family protein [Halothiobacillus neapolitanus]|uniref:YceI family protein n=1 Tax=Halothiobacillus neapolitanus (strain ATCC 23641 / DSM 15147 / CIP 104769 / NCIMB 8539 / c2) TaxID=555778 RepID=D0KZI9_HALNC|nr:YceI family protein [Halothiobacillus neapolitanus]ACX95862.1 YceI family protein [Halothiobacillus neapolitanus c2]TDN66173.1 polyisoprenoid-binding protein YceI [Halothiobacillus neapolitanus]